MLLHKPSGELIHPIHVQNALLSSVSVSASAGVTTSSPASASSVRTDEHVDQIDQMTLNLISGLVPNNRHCQNNTAMTTMTTTTMMETIKNTTNATTSCNATPPPSSLSLPSSSVAVPLGQDPVTVTETI